MNTEQDVTWQNIMRKTVKSCTQTSTKCQLFKNRIKEGSNIYKNRQCLSVGSYSELKSFHKQKNLCTPMFIAAQFTIAKYWKQPKCPSANEWIKKTMVYLHNGILCSREKEGAYTRCNSMDGTGEHYAKWNNPGSERKYHMISLLSGT